jgi:hypothetical protein
MAEQEGVVDFGDIDVSVPELNPDNALLDMGGAALDFNPDVYVAASKLPPVTMASVCRALWMRAGATSTRNFVPEETMTLKEYIAMCNLIGSLGSSRANNVSVGKVVPSEVNMLISHDIDVLKALILSPPAPTSGQVTDGTLSRFIARMRGVRIERVKDTMDAIFHVPNCPARVVVSGIGASRGRVVEGGREFIDWYNLVKGTVHKYAIIHPDAVKHAFFLQTYVGVSIREEKLIFTDRILNKGKLAKFYGESSPNLRSFFTVIKKMMLEVFKTPENRPGLGIQKQTDAYVEYLLSHAYRTTAPANLAKISALSNAINKEHEAFLSRQSVTIPTLFSQGRNVDPSKISLMRNGQFEVPEWDLKFATYGQVVSMVRSSRDHIRILHDLPDKSDSPGMGYSAGVSSSVAMKIHCAIDALRHISGFGYDGLIPHVDAYGTGDLNHWQMEVESATKDVTFYDLDRANAPTNPATFGIADVTKLLPGQGKGRFIFDDTINLPKAYGEQQSEKSSERKKIDSVIRADYDGGFLKLYLGNSDDAGVSVTQNPIALKSIYEHYDRVVLSQGGSLHSPEYYVVFCKTPKDEVSITNAWVPPVLVAANGSRSYQWMESDTPDKDVARKRLVNYLATWIALKIYDMLKANHYLNARVRFGDITYEQQESWITVYATPPLSLGGCETMTSRVSETLVTSAPDIDLGPGAPPTPVIRV